MAVGIDQQREKHPGMEWRISGAANLVRVKKLGNIHQADSINNQMNNVGIRQPILHVHRKKCRLRAVWFSEIFGHNRSISLMWIIIPLASFKLNQKQPIHVKQNYTHILCE